MRAAVIDIGSSSIKLVIGEREEDRIKVLESLKRVIPIGKHTFLKGRISQEIINQATGILATYKQLIQEYDVGVVKTIATTAVREAQNKDIFLDTVFRKTGFSVEVFNIGDVVYYIDAFLSLKLKKAYPIHEKNLLIAELGAGSLDISIMEKGYTLMSMGIPIGTLRLKQFKGTIDGSAEEVNEAVKEYIENEILYLREILPKLQIDDIILIDENYTTVLYKILGNKKLESNFFQLKSSEAENLLAKISENNPDSLVRDFGVPMETAETIDGYANILNTLFKLNKNKYIYILETSLPEALLAHELFGLEADKETHKNSQLVSVARFLCQKFNVDLKHVQHVAGLCETLFGYLQEHLGLEEKDLLYLTLAAYLHDVGMYINNSGHHKHSEYVISSLSLFRLQEEEIKTIACVARYHRKAPPNKTHILYNSLPGDRQILVQKLSALLRIANALDSSHKQKTKKLEVEISRKQEINLIIQSSENFLLEKTNFLDKKELFEEITGNKINLVIRNQ